MIKYVKNEENFKSDVLEASKVLLVDFYATWCGPCNMLSPILEKIADDQNEFDIVKIDIDELRDIAIDCGIEVVPTLLIFKNGKPVEKIEGLVDKIEIMKKMEEYK